MTAAKIRADYEQLEDAARLFGQQAQATRQTLQSLESAVDVLQGGDWVGQGASAFYQEMAASVMPAVTRLVGALESAQQATLQMSQMMAQAEADAARVLRGDGAAPGGELQAAGGVAAGGVAAGGAGVGSAVAGSPAESAFPGALPGPGAGGASRPAAAKTGVASNPQKAVRDLLTKLKLDPKVVELVLKSPTLVNELKALQDKGFQFKFGTRPPGDKEAAVARSETHFHPRKIDIYDDGDMHTNPESYVQRLAHEAGIAQDDPAYRLNKNLVKQLAQQGDPHLPTVAKDKAEYLRNTLTTVLKLEAKGMFNEVAVRNEILKSSGGKTDIGVSDADNQKAFQSVFDDFQKSPQKPADSEAALGKIQKIYTKDGALEAEYTKELEEEWDSCEKGGDCGKW